VTNTQIISTAQTVLGHITVEVKNGGKFKKSGTGTLSIENLIAGSYEIFNGFASGDITVGTDTPKIYAEWWGIDGTADEVEINMAIVAANRVDFFSKTYTVAGAIKYKDNTVIKGSAKVDTLILANITGAVLQSINTATRYYNIILERFKVDNTTKTNAGGIGIDLTKISSSTIRDVYAYNVETGFLINGEAYYNSIYDSIVHTVITGIKIENNANENKIYAGKIDDSTTGISIDQASNTQIYGPSMENFTTGIDVGPSNNAISTFITSCRLENAVLGGTGIKIGTASHTTIMGCYPQNLSKYVDLGTNKDTTIIGNYGGLTASPNDNNAWRQRGLIFSGIIDFADGDTTPAVNLSSIFKTANTSATKIHTFDGGQEGQVIFVIINDVNTTIDFDLVNLKGNRGKIWKATIGDYMICTYDGTNWNCVVSRGSYTIPALADEATPSILGYDIWLTGGTTTITDFDDGIEGEIIKIIAEHSVTITDGTNIFLNGSANWAMTATDTLTLICKADGFWYELSRGDNGA
jgi:hypothetical protein